MHINGGGGGGGTIDGSGSAGQVATWVDSNTLTGVTQGAGGGLDADLLDGQHASAFAASAHTHALTAITPVATDRLLGRDTAGAGACEELTVGGGVEFTGSGGIQRSALTGDVTASAGSGTLTIANDAVTYAKMQNVSATDKLLGRSTAGAGDVEEIACTAAGRALLDDVDASAQRTTLGLAIGTDVQAYDAGLLSLAALPTMADRVAYSTAADTWAETPLTAFGRSLIDDADASAGRTTLGLGTAAVEAASAFAAASHAHAAGDITSGQLALARGGTAADLSATGGASQVLKQTSVGGAVTVGTLSASDVGAVPTSRTLTAGTGLTGGGDLSADRTISLSVPVSLANGGTGADLSATGGTGQFLRQSSAGAAITVGAIAHADLGSGGGTGTKYLRDDMTWQTVSAGATDHGALTGLGDDDHTQYALLAGRSGGQTLIGGTGSGDDLTLQSTAHATRGTIFFGSGGVNVYNDVNARWGMGVAAPARALEVRSTSAQQRWSYDASYYVELTCGSSGDLSILGNLGARVIIGFGATAAGTGFPIAIGSSPSAGGASAIAVGRSAGASGSSAIAIGASASASNVNCVAIGTSASAAGSDSVAIGCSAATATRGVAIGYLAVNTGHTYSTSIGYSATTTAANQLVFGSNAAATTQSDIYFCGVTGATPPASKLNACGGSGTDIAGASLTIAGGRGTGAGAGGSILFQTSAAGASGTTLRTLTTRLTIDSTGKALFSGEVELDADLNHDGTNVGFYGVAPVARPAAYTQTYSTADRTLSAYTADNESVAYTGAADGEAQLADLNALRTAYENLRAFVEDLAQHHNSVVDDLQAVGLLQ